jgi:hypothetical protein
MNKIKLQPILIAPCGMNCGICKAHLRDKKEKNYCRGCNDNPVYDYCQKCKMRDCPAKKSRFCDCENFPCPRLKQLDKRYRTRYHMSMIENLEYIKKFGMKKFLAKEKKKWRCPKCGGLICCHDNKCYTCDTIKSWKG